MSIPKDGYYRADVILDGRGLWPLFVHVRSGAIYDGAENKLLPEACSNFREVNTTLMVRVWPDDAAMELEALRDEVATLRKDQWVPAALLQILELHRIPVGSPELLEAKLAVEAEIDTLRTANAGLAKEVRQMSDLRERAEDRARRLEEALDTLEVRGDQMNDELYPPDSNCSCHISPPCNDCTDWASVRLAKRDWEEAKQKAAKAKGQP